MTYPVGAQLPAGAVHASVTVDPLVDTLNPAGAPGAHEPPPLTVTITSFDGPLTPAPFFARTRTKYVPAGTLSTFSAGAGFPVSTFARSVRPLADPASTTYDEGGSPA